MAVDHLLLLIEFHVHAEIEGNTPEIMHPEHILHRIIYVCREVIDSVDEEIIDTQHDCGNDCAVIMNMQHDQLSVNTLYNEPNRHNKVLKSAIPNL